MEHTDTFDAPLMHEVLRRWQTFNRCGRQHRRQQQALKVDKDESDNIGWTSRADECNGKWYTRWDVNGTAKYWQIMIDCPVCGTSVIQPWPLWTCCAKFHSDLFCQVPRHIRSIVKAARNSGSDSTGWTSHADEWHGWLNGAPQYWQAMSHCT